MPALVAVATLGACSVDFDVDREDTFSCSSDADCINGYVCKFSVTDPNNGVCAKDNEVVDNCIDMDNDNFGEGCIGGPDCDDSNPDVNPEAPEICDGLDNDCDCARDADGNAVDCEIGTQIDEPVDCAEDSDCPEDPQASNGMVCVKEDGADMGVCQYRCDLNVGVCIGALTICTTLESDEGEVTGEVLGCGEMRPDGVVPYGPDYARVSESQEACDELDNNCNGTVDGNDECTEMQCDPDNPRACSTDVGICSVGERECNDGVIGECVNPDPREPVIMQGDVEETCNGLDDDCNGIVDDAADGGGRAGSICPNKCPFGMTEVINPNGTPGNDRWCIDRFEASRPDATATDMGMDTTRAVSRQGVTPWTGLTIEEAQAACRGPQGSQFPRKRLCQLREITFTCAGVNENTFPYGDTYMTNVCNGVDAGVVMSVPTGPTEEMGDTDFEQCSVDRNGVLIYDLSGNVSEFCIENSLPRVYGGSYLDGEDNLRCSSASEGQGQMGPNIGFRCCFDPQ